MVVRKDLPTASLKDFIAYAKSNPGKLNYGSAGGGSATHLACVLFGQQAGVGHLVARVGVEIFLWTKLARIDEHAGHHHRRPLPGQTQKTGMTGMQRAHGGHKTDRLPAA